MARTVLVTGVSRHLGGRFARLLTADPTVDRVIGVDVVPPRSDLGGAEFVRADIRNPIIAKVISAADVDTVVHMSVIATPLSAGGRSLMKEVNVIGTMQLLAACQKAESVQRLVVKSSSTVYGASPQGPGDVHRGHGAQAAAAVGVRQGLRRGRGLRARLLPPPPRRRGHHAAVRQLPRAGHQDPAVGLLRAAGGPDGPGLRPAAAVRARGRPARRPAARDRQGPARAPTTSRATA